MKTFRAIGIGLGLAAGLALAGCEDGVDDTTDGVKPAVDANGVWNAKEDGVQLGEMTLDVSNAGMLKGSLLTTQGTEALLSGTLAGYAAEFTMTFSAEYYEVALTFATNGLTAGGFAQDDRGFKRIMTLTRPATVNTNSI